MWKVKLNLGFVRAQHLPFKDNVFNIVIGESIIAFLEDKQKAVDKFVLVEPGGYVGLNEATWLKTPQSELME